MNGTRRPLHHRSVALLFDGEEFLMACLLWAVIGLVSGCYQAARLTGAITGGARPNWFFNHSGGAVSGAPYTGDHLFWVATVHTVGPMLAVAILMWLLKAAWEMFRHPVS